MTDWINDWVLPGAAAVGPGSYALVAAGALLVTAVSKGGFGGGAGALAVPLMLIALPWRFVIGMWLPLLIVCDLFTVRRYPREWARPALVRLAPGMVLAIAATTAALSMAGRAQGEAGRNLMDVSIKLVVAMTSFLFIAMSLRRAPDPSTEPWKPTWTAATSVGLVAGVITTIAHVAGPILTMYLLPQRLERRTFVGTAGRIYLTFNLVKVPFFVAAGFITAETLKYSLWLLPLAPAGVALGAWLNRRISEVWFVRVVYVLLAVTSLKLTLDAVKMLVGS